jgi:predicted nucleotidyltransferase component of viral defense system
MATGTKSASFEAIRKTAIKAMFADKDCAQKLVLKGGNALHLAYGVGSRASLDFDFSIPGDFQDLEDTKTHLLQSIRSSFAACGFVVFDESFQEVPILRDEGVPGKGYSIKFKIIAEGRHRELRENLAKLRMQAEAVGPDQKRVFQIEISKGEFCDEKREMNLDDQPIYVYSPAMIAIEKIRAICQQMPEYTLRKKKTARARDFYDLWTLVQVMGLRLEDPENLELFKSIFAAKEVPLELIARIETQREFHRAEWSYVESSVVDDTLESFDYYFEFVLMQVRRLEALWVK